MQHVPFSLIIPTIGIPELFICLASLRDKNPAPAEVIVVIDHKGRKLSNLGTDFEHLQHQIKAAYPNAIIAHNEHDEHWEMNNQTFNIGVKKATTPFVYLTHDDVYFPNNVGHFVSVQRALDRIRTGFPQRVVGAVFPGHHMEINVTAPTHGEECLSQHFSAVAGMISLDFWREIGGFDMKHGMWWDAHVQGELCRRNCWLYFVPTMPVMHFMNRALRANSHAHGFTVAPRWSNVAGAYNKVYGSDWKTFGAWAHRQSFWGNWYGREEAVIKI